MHILKQRKDQLGDHIKIVKIDVDKNQALASQWQVRSFPTMVLYQNGKQLWRQSGVIIKEQILNVISEKTK